MKLRLQIALLFTASLLIGYFTGVHVTTQKHNDDIAAANRAVEEASNDMSALQSRLDSLCGDAVLKFVPCSEGLEVCICGEPNKYLKKQQ